jgi:hypothetical protein
MASSVPTWSPPVNGSVRWMSRAAMGGRARCADGACAVDGGSGRGPIRGGFADSFDVLHSA